MQRWQWVVLVITLSIAACSRQPDQANLSKIASEAGIRLPASSQLLYEQNGITDKSGLWIIRSDDRFELPGEKELTDSETVRLEMDKHVSADVMGVLADGIAIGHGWRKDNLRYRASMVHSSNGFFVRIERFAQP